MQIKKTILPPVSTNCYLLEVEGSAIIIDPGYTSFSTVHPYIQEKSLRLKSIFLTHSHWDHIADLSQWIEKYQVPFFVHPFDAANVEFPGQDGILCPLDIPGVKPSLFFQDDALQAVLSSSMRVIHTPGHSAGSVCLYFPEEKMLFSGDTLFKGTIGNTSFPGSDRQKMTQSLKRLATLPKETKVYPGHGPTTFLGEEFWIQKFQK